MLKFHQIINIGQSIEGERGAKINFQMLTLTVDGAKQSLFRLNMATDRLIFPPLQRIQENAYVKSFEDYKKLHTESVEEPAKFWGKIAKQFHWKKEPSIDKFLQYNFDVRNGNISIKWMEDGVTNVCYNMLDRNVKEKNLGDRIAFYWYKLINNSSTKYCYHIDMFQGRKRSRGLWKNYI